jgi:hypothetical protein
MHMGYRGLTADDSARHARFASALVLYHLIEGESPDEDEAWRQPKGIITAGMASTTALGFVYMQPASEAVLY